MVDVTKQTGGYREPERLSFPLDEAIYPWLSMLLDAYHIADVGVTESIKRERRKGKKLACEKGCSSCCRTHTTIPVYPLELVGMTWYATEKIDGPQREELKRQLREHEDSDACPFLVGGICVTHAARPLACRQFNVFGQVCAEGEDAYYTRRRDVLTPIKKFTDEAFFIMLPFYGVKEKAERRRVVKTGTVHRMAKVMRSCNWASVADRMDEHDRRKARSS